MVCYFDFRMLKQHKILLLPSEDCLICQKLTKFYYEEYRNFTLIPFVEILLKGTVSTEFGWAETVRSHKLSKTKKLSEIAVFLLVFHVNQTLAMLDTTHYKRQKWKRYKSYHSPKHMLKYWLDLEFNLSLIKADLADQFVTLVSKIMNKHWCQSKANI